MAKDPAFLFYSQDFIVGVQTLSFEDRGKYITILSLMHQQGRMKEETICLLVGSVSVMLKSKFEIDEHGFWYNKRLELETNRRSKYTESRRKNGKLGGKPKKNSFKAYGKHMGNHMEDEIENEIENEIVIENKKESKSKNSKTAKKQELVFPFNNVQFREKWQQWIQFRNEIKKPYKSLMSQQATLKKLSEYSQHEAMAMIDQSIANSWQGIFEIKKGNNGKQHTNPKLEATRNSVEYLANFYGTDAGKK